MDKFSQEYMNKLNRVYTKDELLEMVRDKNRIIGEIDISKIVDTCWPIDYQDTFIVPEGEPLLFRGGGILVNGKNDVPKLKAFGEKEKVCGQLLRRSKINRILAGETDCLTSPLTPEAIGEFERERDLIQEGILRAVEPLLDPDSTIHHQAQKRPEMGAFLSINGGISLPPEIDTPEARKAFGKALKAGYLEKTSTGYKWQGLPKAAAAYLCEKIYCTSLQDPPPEWTILGKFLGLVRLAQTAYQNKGTKGVRPWKQAIDNLF